MIPARLWLALGAFGVLCLSGTAGRADPVPSPSQTNTADSANSAKTLSFEKAWDNVVSGGQQSAKTGAWTLQKTPDGVLVATRDARAGSTGVASFAKDTEILAAIKMRLGADPETSMHTVDVHVDQSVVHLSGQVKSVDAAKRAVQIATETDGVKRVESKMTWSKAGNRTSPGAPNTP